MFLRNFSIFSKTELVLVEIVHPVVFLLVKLPWSDLFHWWVVFLLSVIKKIWLDDMIVGLPGEMVRLSDWVVDFLLYVWLMSA